MLTLAFTMIFSQFAFTEKPAITLAAQEFNFEKVTVTDTHILICNQNEAKVHIFDKQGTLVENLIGNDDVMQLPSEVSWLPEKNRYLVYDGSKREFTAWDTATGDLVETLKTDFDLFFEVGRLLPVKNGYVAPVSLVDERYLVGRFNEKFGNPRYEYEIFSKELNDLSPVLRRTFTVKLSLYGGSRILAIQSLATEVRVYDENLKYKDKISLGIGSWKTPKFKKLQKISKNPIELKKYHPNFSEIVSLEVVSGSIFVVGFRNILGGPGYYYQCYDAATGNPYGATFSSRHQPAGAGPENMYLRDPGQKMKLFVIGFGT